MSPPASTPSYMVIDESFALDTTNFSRLPTPTAARVYQGPWHDGKWYTFDEPKKRDDKAAYRAMAATQHKCRRR